MYASAQPIDFLARAKNASFPNCKLLVSFRSFRMETSIVIAGFFNKNLFRKAKMPLQKER